MQSFISYLDEYCERMREQEETEVSSGYTAEELDLMLSPPNQVGMGSYGDYYEEVHRG